MIFLFVPSWYLWWWRLVLLEFDLHYVLELVDILPGHPEYASLLPPRGRDPSLSLLWFVPSELLSPSLGYLASPSGVPSPDKVGPTSSSSAHRSDRVTFGLDPASVEDSMSKVNRGFANTYIYIYIYRIPVR